MVCYAVSGEERKAGGRLSNDAEAIGLAPEAADGSLRLTLGRLSDAETCTTAAQEIIAAINTEKTKLA